MGGRPLPRMRARRDSAEIQQSGHASRSGPEVKNGKSSAKGKAKMRDNPERGELDTADDVHRRCKKNSSVLSCIDKLIL